MDLHYYTSLRAVYFKFGQNVYIGFPKFFGQFTSLEPNNAFIFDSENGLGVPFKIDASDFSTT